MQKTICLLSKYSTQKIIPLLLYECTTWRKQKYNIILSHSVALGNTIRKCWRVFSLHTHSADLCASVCASYIQKANKSTETAQKVNKLRQKSMCKKIQPRTCSSDIYGISSQHFDTSLKLLLFVTKFNRAKLIVFALSDYNLAENSNNLRSPDFQDSRF